jgi:hypothetical protein
MYVRAIRSGVRPVDQRVDLILPRLRRDAVQGLLLRCRYCASFGLTAKPRTFPLPGLNERYVENSEAMRPVARQGGTQR